jgi:hypothetical protein
MFWSELPKIGLLVILYAFQGLSFGMFLHTIPMLFKKDLTYSEIGVIMLCTTPFSFKILWSPVVEFYYSPSFGKRKSWIVPTQILMTVILYYISLTLEAMLVAKEVYMLATVLTVFIFVITCQDIAVDAWAIEMLHP